MINVWIANGSVNVRTRPFRDILYANHLLSISKAQWDTALKSRVPFRKHTLSLHVLGEFQAFGPVCFSSAQII